MDCQTALHILMETPFAEHSDEEWEAAGEHMESCPQCHEVFHHGSVLDQRIAQVMVQVAPPEKLQRHILDQLQANRQIQITGVAVAEEPEKVTSTARPLTGSQSKWVRPLLIMAGCVLIAALFWQFRPQPPQPQLYTLRQLSEVAIQNEWETFPEFDGGFSVSQSKTLFQWERTPQLGLSHDVRGYQPNGQSQQIMAIYHFELPTRRATANGLLLVIPAKYLKESPSEEYLMEGNPEYLGNYVSVSWKEDDLVYVCLLERVPDGGDEFHHLKQILNGQLA